MEKLRWGILSTAKIGIEKVIPAMQRGKRMVVVAIASRDYDRAKAAAEPLNINRVYGSYEALLADPQVDAIYNPLPNHLHVPWTIKALEAGKHVLCEKPVALGAKEAEDLLAAVTGHVPHLKVMEAFMYRFHPQWVRTYEMVVNGKIGTLRTIRSFFSYYNDDPLNIRNKADMGGGALMDIGCYAISLSRWLFNTEPARVTGVSEIDPDFHTDRITSGILDFSSGTSTFTCATQLPSFQEVQILGTEGRIEIERPFTPPPDRPTRIRYTHAGSTEEIEFEKCDQYTLQGDQFSRAVLEDLDVPTPLQDAVANMHTIDALRLSVRNKT
jgi:predicted dehydrogenase